VTITQGGVYLPGKRASLPVLEIRDPQIRDPDPRIFTGIRIRRSGIRIRVFLQGFRSGIRDPREKQCGSPTLIRVCQILGQIKFEEEHSATRCRDPTFNIKS